MRKRKPFRKFLPSRAAGRAFRQSDVAEGKKTLKKSGFPAKFLLTREMFSIMMYGHAAEGHSGRRATAMNREIARKR